MKYFDTHCHLDMEPLRSDIEGAVERAAKAGVAGMINVGASMRGSQRSVEIANLYPHIWASVGLHPHEAETLLDLKITIEKLEELAGGDKVVAIGEIGLDYFDPSTRGEVSDDLKEKQKELFRAQMILAKNLNLPIIFHVRDAWDDFFELVEEERGIRGVVHCFTGGPKEAQECVDLGLYVGFTGLVTFKNQSVDPIKEAVKIVPLDRLLIETDAPFLAPEPHRGKPNAPEYVPDISIKISELKEVETSFLADATIKNAKDLFLIKRV